VNNSKRIQKSPHKYKCYYNPLTDGPGVNRENRVVEEVPKGVCIVESALGVTEGVEIVVADEHHRPHHRQNHHVPLQSAQHFVHFVVEVGFALRVLQILFLHLLHERKTHEAHDLEDWEGRAEYNDYSHETLLLTLAGLNIVVQVRPCVILQASIRSNCCD